MNDSEHIYTHITCIFIFSTLSHENIWEYNGKMLYLSNRTNFCVNSINVSSSMLAWYNNSGNLTADPKKITLEEQSSNVVMSHFL